MRASSAAWLSAGLHVFASFAMLFLLREGLPGFEEEHRLAYMAAHRVAWVTGWLLWQVTAVSLIALYAALAKELGGILPATGLATGVAALAIDIAAEARYIGILPDLRGPAFAALDRELEVLIGYAANGLYTLGLLLIVAGGWRVLPAAGHFLAVPVILSGFALAVASLLHDARMETITSAILFPLFTLWIIRIAFWLRARESSS